LSKVENKKSENFANKDQQNPSNSEIVITPIVNKSQQTPTKYLKKLANYQLKDFSIVVQKLNLDKYKMPVKLNELIKDGIIDMSEKFIPEKKSCKRRASKSVSVITISEDESDGKDVCMNDTVFAKRNDKHYYPAIIMKIINNLFRVKYVIDDSLNIVSRNVLILIKELQTHDDVLILNDKNEYWRACINFTNKDYFEIFNYENHRIER
jgi:hypothetical protein